MSYLSNKTIHFIGIGGIGMSAIAESLLQMGIHVQGSNNVENEHVIRLREKGIQVFIGQRDGSCLKNADMVVISSAVPENNPELLAAKEKGLPIGHRSEMLAELLRLKQGITVAGTHGKTTTTAMIADVLEKGGLEPSYIVGGIMNVCGSNAKIGRSDWMVVEADESDGSFLRLPKMISVVTNIDPEHLDYYGSFEQMKKAFIHYLQTTSFYGFCVACLDHPVVKEVIEHIPNRRIITYGLDKAAEIHAENIHIEPGKLNFDIVIKNEIFPNWTLPMFGTHNILNAMVPIAIAKELGMPLEKIKKALSYFDGVQRRFTKRGTFNGITIYDDYAHHPVEIAAVLKAAREAVGTHQVVAIFQPHRYSRAKDLADAFAHCFEKADRVYVTDIYAAGEAPLPDISRDILIEKIKASGHKGAFALTNKNELKDIVLKHMSAGDLMIGLGAGDISKWMKELPEILNEREAV